MQKEVDLSKRNFLKGLILGTGAGILTSELALRPEGAAVSQLEKLGMSAGNANMENRKPQYSGMERAQITVISPLMEECMFRLIPSNALDQLEDAHPRLNLVTGSDNPQFTRREFITGLASSVVFALSHNITKDGFDTKHVPVTIGVMGMALWYLQRKLGFASNTAFHMWHNYRLLP